MPSPAHLPDDHPAKPQPQLQPHLQPQAPPVAPCLNCGTVAVGPWCHECGQQGGHLHRSVRHLAAEFLETFTHADSRFWRTMRRLALDPARLTNDYLAGRRAREIPPLRLFFVMLFLLFGIGSLTATMPDLSGLEPDAHRKVAAQLQTLDIARSPLATRWLRLHLLTAFDHPSEVIAVMRDWAERFAFLMLPIAALILWVLYLPRRSFTLYDHLIVSIHSLSFVALVLIATILASELPGDLGGVLLLALPIHLFAHLRGVYRSGIAGTLVRMALLGTASSVAFLLLLLALAGIALQLGARA